MPESTRKTLMRPANGSATVLKMNAAGPPPSTPASSGFFAGRRDALDEQVEEAGRAEVLRGDAAGDREELAGDDRVLERGGQLVARDLALLEVALHQRLVGLDDGVDELLAVLGGLRGDARRGCPPASPRARRRGRGTRACGRGRRCPSARARGRSGSGRRRSGRRADAAELLERGEEVGALAVEHRHEDDAAEAERVRTLPEARRLHLDAVDAVDGEERALDDAERRERVRLEARVAGRVDEVDLAVLPLRVADRGRTATSAGAARPRPSRRRSTSPRRSPGGWSRRPGRASPRRARSCPVPRWPTTATFRILLGSNCGTGWRVYRLCPATSREDACVHPVLRAARRGARYEWRR